MTEADPVQLVAGLGNPGDGHAGDRHNAGFWLLDALALHWRVEFREESRFKAQLGRAPSGVRLLVLDCPKSRSLNKIHAPNPMKPTTIRPQNRASELRICSMSA